MRGRSDHALRPVSPQPARELTFRASRMHFVRKNTAFCASATYQKAVLCHQTVCLLWKVTCQHHHIDMLHLPRKVTRRHHGMMHLTVPLLLLSLLGCSFPYLAVTLINCSLLCLFCTVLYSACFWLHCSILYFFHLVAIYLSCFKLYVFLTCPFACSLLYLFFTLLNL